MAATKKNMIAGPDAMIVRTGSVIVSMAMSVAVMPVIMPVIMIVPMLMSMPARMQGVVVCHEVSLAPYGRKVA